MFCSKLYKATSVLRYAVPKWLAPGPLTSRVQPPALRAPSRNFFGLLPRDQYENNEIPKKFQLSYALINHWEIIPLFFCVAFDICVVLGFGLYNGVMNKVDIQFSGHNWNCISRTMDLRHPTVHKGLVFFQRYEPWPEMQDVLDKMRAAEHRLQTRVSTCGK